MRDDVRVDEVWFEGPDDDHWEAAARPDPELRRSTERFLRETEAFAARLES